MHELARYLNPLTLRSAASSDREFLTRLYASTRDDLRQIPAHPVIVESLIAMQQNMQTAGYRNAYPDAAYLVIDRDEEAVGRIVIDTAPGEIRLVDISLLPPVRGKGIGSAVLRAVQQFAAEKHLPLMLSVHRNNPRARRLYLALGFQLVSGDEMAEQMRWDSAAPGLAPPA